MTQISKMKEENNF